MVRHLRTDDKSQSTIVPSATVRGSPKGARALGEPSECETHLAEPGHAPGPSGVPLWEPETLSIIGIQGSSMSGCNTVQQPAFTGQVWFDFSSPSVWVFYQWVRALASTGTAVGIEWLPLPKGTERAAMATLLAIDVPEDRGRYIHALLGLVHIEGRSPAELKTVAEALRAADLNSVIVKDAHPLLADLRSRASGLGVDSVPMLYRRGPVMSIQLNPAVLSEDPRDVANTIDQVMDSDGIWELRKP